MHDYIFYCEDAKNVSEKRKAVRPAHIARLQTLQDAGRLRLAGPLKQFDNTVCGSLIIATFDNLNEAQEWIAADPYSTAEVYQRITVKLFEAVFS